MAQQPYKQLQSEPPSAPLLEESGQDKAAMFSQMQQQHQMQGDDFKPLYPNPPPPYSEQPPQPVPMQPYPPQPYPPQPYPPQPHPSQPHPSQPHPSSMQPYPQPVAPASTVVVMQHPPQHIVPSPQQPASVVVLGTSALAPGTCTVCRKGKIKKSPSCCTYCCCLFLLPLGILPGIIAYFCCCQQPKCTNCGYSP